MLVRLCRCLERARFKIACSAAMCPSLIESYLCSPLVKCGLRKTASGMWHAEVRGFNAVHIGLLCLLCVKLQESYIYRERDILSITRIGSERGSSDYNQSSLLCDMVLSHIDTLPHAPSLIGSVAIFPIWLLLGLCEGTPAFGRRDPWPLRLPVLHLDDAYFAFKAPVRPPTLTWNSVLQMHSFPVRCHPRSLSLVISASDGAVCA